MVAAGPHPASQGTLQTLPGADRQREPWRAGSCRVTRSECLRDVRRVDALTRASGQRYLARRVRKRRAGVVGVRPARRPGTSGRVERSDCADH